MSTFHTLARFLFTSFWATELNRSGFTVREVHGLRSATVWDGGEERYVKFYFTRQKVKDPQAPVPAAALEIPDDVAKATESETPSLPEYMLHDSRPPFASAIGISLRLSPSLTKPKEVEVRVNPPGLTNAPFARPYLAD